jgi:bilirubin oxidase
VLVHCHNLIHEDHDMMAAFNVSSLGDWGYPETTHFIDPMEEKYRAKDFKNEDYEKKDGDFEEEHVQKKLEEFYMMDAYSHVDTVEKALVDYWNNGGPKKTTLSTVVISSTTSTAAASSSQATAAASTTKALAATSTNKSDDDKKTTTKAPVATSTKKSDDDDKKTTTKKKN